MRIGSALAVDLDLKVLHRGGGKEQLAPLGQRMAVVRFHLTAPDDRPVGGFFAHLNLDRTNGGEYEGRLNAGLNFGHWFRRTPGHGTDGKNDYDDDDDCEHHSAAFDKKRRINRRGAGAGGSRERARTHLGRCWRDRPGIGIFCAGSRFGRGLARRRSEIHAAVDFAVLTLGRAPIAGGKRLVVGDQFVAIELEIIGVVAQEPRI